jgi:hypothetical protein
MKTLIAVLVAAGIGFAAAYAIVSSQAAARLAKERAAFEAEKSKLAADLAAAEGKSGKVRTVEVRTPATVIDNRLTPQEILDKLVAINPGTETNRNATIRLVIYYLESLAECGPPALPVIEKFFARNEDVDYSTQGNRGNNDGGQQGRGNFGGFRRGQLRMDFLMPPSLRLGLVDVVSQIGGEQAEKILAGVLRTTGRGVEVAYLARTLEDMTPGKYRDLAVTVAKDLLSHPISIDNPDRLDQSARGYLYSVLEMYGDTTFVATAQTQLIGPDGRLDGDAFNYLNRVLKEQTVPLLYNAYNDARITNRFEKTRIASQVLSYAGMNDTANKMFKEIVTTTEDDRARMSAIIGLLGGGGAGGPGGGGGRGGPFGGEPLTDPKLIKERMDLLVEIAANITDEQTLRVIEMTGQNLQNMLDGKPVDFENFFGGRGRGGRRGDGQQGRSGQPASGQATQQPTVQTAQ